METATQTLHRLTSYGLFDEASAWDPPVEDPRVVQDLVANDLDRLPWFYKRYPQPRDPDLRRAHQPAPLINLCVTVRRVIRGQGWRVIVAEHGMPLSPAKGTADMSHEPAPGEWQGNPAEQPAYVGYPMTGFGASAYGQAPPTYLIWARIAAAGGVLFNVILGFISPTGRRLRR